MSLAGFVLADLLDVDAGAGALLAGGGAEPVGAGAVGVVDVGAGIAGEGALAAGAPCGGVLASWPLLPHALSISRPARVVQYRAMLRA